MGLHQFLTPLCFCVPSSGNNAYVIGNEINPHFSLGSTQLSFRSPDPKLVSRLSLARTPRKSRHAACFPLVSIQRLEDQPHDKSDTTNQANSTTNTIGRKSAWSQFYTRSNRLVKPLVYAVAPPLLVAAPIMVIISCSARGDLPILSQAVNEQVRVALQDWTWFKILEIWSWIGFLAHVGLGGMALVYELGWWKIRLHPGEQTPTTNKDWDKAFKSARLAYLCGVLGLLEVINDELPADFQL